MPDTIRPQQRVQEHLKRKFQEDPMRTARYIGPSADTETLSSAAERRAWWTKEPSVERNAQEYLTKARMAAEAQKMPVAEWKAQQVAVKGEPKEVTAARAQKFFDAELPEDTELRAHALFTDTMLYPARLDLMRSGARLFDTRAQQAYSDEMARLGPPPEGSDEQ